MERYCIALIIKPVKQLYPMSRNWNQNYPLFAQLKVDVARVLLSRHILEVISTA
jgi:hypothetical protein